MGKILVNASGGDVLEIYSEEPLDMVVIDWGEVWNRTPDGTPNGIPELTDKEREFLKRFGLKEDGTFDHSKYVPCHIHRYNIIKS